MPEKASPPAGQSAFIWYHADMELQAQLLDWVEKTGRLLHVPAKLMVRRQPERTTFMEIYELNGLDEQAMQLTLQRIEELAARQTWFAALQSPRRAELFAHIEP